MNRGEAVSEQLAAPEQMVQIACRELGTRFTVAVSVKSFVGRCEPGSPCLPLATITSAV